MTAAAAFVEPRMPAEKAVVPGGGNDVPLEAVFESARAKEASVGGSSEALALYEHFLGRLLAAEGSTAAASALAIKDAKTVKRVEAAIEAVANLCVATGDAPRLDAFTRSLEAVWERLARAKTARLVRHLLGAFDKVAEGKRACPEERTAVKALQMVLVKDLLQWASRDKRAYLRQSLECRLADLYLENRLYSEALALVGSILRELKQMDDKLTLIEVHLLECRIYFALRNGPKAKAALTAARSNANAVYCPPALQAALDMQSALVHADDADFKTAISYFIEALDSYAAEGDCRGSTALKYMMLCKIMMGQADEIDSLVNGKVGQRYALESDVAAMKAVGDAHKNKSLAQFEAALSAFPEQLGTDAMVHAHFTSLYDDLLQQNLLLIAAPYSRVQIAHVAAQIGLPLPVIEAKLSMMILDKKLKAIIDQNEQCLVLIDEPASDKTLAYSLQAIKSLESVVDSLYRKASLLSS